MQQYLAAMEVTEGEEQKHLVEELGKGLGDQQAEEKEETEVPMEVREMLGDKLSTEEAREDVQQQTQPVEEEQQQLGMEETAARKEAEVPQVQQLPEEAKQVIAVPAGQVEEEEKETEPSPPEEKDESVRVFAEGQQQSQEEMDEQIRAATMGKRLDEQHIEEQAAASKEQEHEEQVGKQEAVTAILIEERIAKNIGEMVGVEPEEPSSFAEDTVSMEEVEQLPEVDDAEVEEMLEEMMESVFQAPTPPPTKESPMLLGKHPGLGMEIPKTSTPSLILPMQPGVYTPPSQRGLKTRVV